MDLQELAMQYLEQATEARRLAGEKRGKMQHAIGRERKKLQMQMNDWYEAARACERICIRLQSIANHGRRS